MTTSSESYTPVADLSTEFLGREYQNPLVVASGTLIERHEDIEPFLDAGAGAVVPRTTRLIMERTSHPSPHLYHAGARSGANMLNAEWTGSDISYWRDYLPAMADTSKVIMAASGRDIEGCVKVCQELDAYRFPYLELNVGCGVTNGVLGYITRDEEHIKRLVGSIKEADVTTPIALKLGHSDYIVHLSQVAKDAGADGIVAINTLGPVFDFDISTNGDPSRTLGVQGARGGLSGSSIFHTALTDVALISKEVGIPVAASGGVTTPERAVKMIMAGAGIVQVYTYLHDRGRNAPGAMTSLIRSFDDYLAEHDIASVEEIKGKALGLMDLPTEMTPQIPKVDHDICTGCDRCIPVCLPDTINTVPRKNRNQHVVQVMGETCVGCGACVSVCPVPGAISL